MDHRSTSTPTRGSLSLIFISLTASLLDPAAAPRANLFFLFTTDQVDRSGHDRKLQTLPSPCIPSPTPHPQHPAHQLGSGVNVMLRGCWRGADIGIHGWALSTMIRTMLVEVSVIHFALFFSFSIVVLFPLSYASRRQLHPPPLPFPLVFSSYSTFADVGVRPS